MPWSTAVSNDLRFPQVGQRPIWMRLLHGYMSRVYRAGARDPVVALGLLEVINLARHPAALLSSGIAARVLLPRPRVPSLPEPLRAEPGDS